MLRVVMWSTDPVGKQMAGPGIRYHRLAIELAQRFEVTLVAPGGGIPAVPYIFRSAESVSSASDVEADVVVAQSLPLGLIRSLHRAGIRLVFDLYAPALVEAAANLAEERSADRSDGIRYEEVVAVTRVALQLGDAFLCASDRQRDHWLGALAALGRVSPEVYERDPALRSLVAVVPFGLDPAPPSSGSPLVKGVLPGIGTDDRLLLWGGGVWNWFDPLTVIRAVGRLSESRSDVKLLFLGMKHPSSAVAEMTMADRAIALAAELDLDGSSVFFNRDWVPYDERLAWFAEADLGVSAHRDSFEARLAFRTRLLDHIAVGTPLVVTQGDVLGDLVQSRGMGRALAPSDVDGWAVALAGLLDDDRAYAAAKTAVKAAREELSWGRIGEPLAELIERVASTPRQRSSGGGVLLRAAATMARSSLDRRGLRATLAAASRAISGSARR
jgi:glycosyltransferase involved in cell wall biosynthesis